MRALFERMESVLRNFLDQNKAPAQHYHLQTFEHVIAVHRAMPARDRHKRLVNRNELFDFKSYGMRITCLLDLRQDNEIQYAAFFFVFRSPSKNVQSR